MRFLIKEPAFIQGVYHPCPKGTTAVLNLPLMEAGPIAEDGVAGEPVPFSHVSLDWEPLDEEARDAQIRVHAPKQNQDGRWEHHAMGREGIGQRVGHALDPKTKDPIAVPWKGKRILGKLLPMIDPATKKVVPRPEFDHENTEAPLDRVIVETKSGTVADDGEALDPAVAAQNLADRKAFVAFQKEQRDREAAEAARDPAKVAQAAADARAALAAPAIGARPAKSTGPAPSPSPAPTGRGKSTDDDPIGALGGN